MASLKGQKAIIAAPMRVDGTAAFITDKRVLTAITVAADTIDFRIAGGSRVCQLEFILDDCDTGTTFVFGVGYRAVDPASTLTPSATYFAAAGQTTGQAGGRLECAFKPIKFEEDVYIQLTVGTAQAGISGSPEIHMVAGVNQEGIK